MRVCPPASFPVPTPPLFRKNHRENPVSTFLTIFLTAAHEKLVSKCCFLFFVFFYENVKNYSVLSFRKNEYSLFMAGLRVTKSNAKLFNNVGHALEAQQRHEEALAYFKRAARYKSDV